METTAVYDKDTDELIVNTPSPLAQKYWITNGALHAHHIVVFAQLHVNGVNEGIHGVLVPIRCVGKILGVKLLRMCIKGVLMSIRFGKI